MLKSAIRTFIPAILALAPVAALAQTGTSSSYGSYGYGQQIPTQSLTPFDRSWNHFNQSKRQARAGARYMRQHYYGNYRPY